MTAVVMAVAMQVSTFMIVITVGHAVAIIIGDIITVVTAAICHCFAAVDQLWFYCQLFNAVAAG